MTGRPPGEAHPMPMLDFWRLFCEQLPVTPTVKSAYEAAEAITFAEYSRYRFKSYKAFRNAKCNFIKARCNKK